MINIDGFQHDAFLPRQRGAHNEKNISAPPVCIFFVCRIDKILSWTSVNLVNTENLVQPFVPFLLFLSLKPACKCHFCASSPSDIQILDDMDPWPWSRGPIASRPWVNYISTNGNRIRLFCPPCTYLRVCLASTFLLLLLPPTKNHVSSA